jgi:hypothetical protein
MLSLADRMTAGPSVELSLVEPDPLPERAMRFTWLCIISNFCSDTFLVFSVSDLDVPGPSFPKVHLGSI